MGSIFGTTILPRGYTPGSRFLDRNLPLFVLSDLILCGKVLGLEANMALYRSSVLCFLLCLIVSSLYSQNSEMMTAANTTFQSKVRVVLLDVVVTDRNDNPIGGLQKDDFRVFEEGKPQTIASFEEHKGAPANQPEMSPLPPHFYTNYPLIKPADSVNVLVLDALNTPLGDQANVRKQMVSYLKNIQPGPRLAILTLTSQMRMIEGFTADPKVLLAALNHKNWGGGPQSSPLLRTDIDDNADQQMLAAMASGQASADAISAMQQFLAEEKDFHTYSRVEMTLQALQELARYLGGFPGRKNVIWFSGSFPISVLPTKGQDYDFNFSEEFKKKLRETTNLLAAAQVAIYPIGAEGLDTDSYTSAAHVSPLGANMTVPQPGQTSSMPSGESEEQELLQEHTDRNASQETMDEMAKDTGGEAFYNTNGLKEAMAEAMKNGAHYYTISYSPTDTKMDGGYRPIKVQLRTGHYKLSYRRGYFADRTRGEASKEIKPGQAKPSGDPLQPLMGRGVPDATQILYKIRVLPSEPQPPAGATVAGDNATLKGPLTRYAVDFAISTRDLDLAATPDGMHHGNIEVTLVAYDHDGHTLNWIVRSMDMSLKPQLYAAFQQGGVQLHEEIDVPKGEVYLRTGVYDRATDKAGTLEIPLGVKSSGPAAASAGLQAGARSAIPTSSDPVTTANSSANSTLNQKAIPAANVRSARPMSPAELNREIAVYCKAMASTSEHADALEGGCRYVLSLRMKLPDIICTQDTERYWWTPGIAGMGRHIVYGESHRDHVTAQVEYREGQEYYTDVRIEGDLLNADEGKSVGAASSDGEFSMILQNIFIPSSKAKFRFVREDKVHSAEGLIFEFNIQQSDNHYYFLEALDSAGKSELWYPAYHGQIWLDKNTFHVLRLERETPEMPKDPIKSVRTITNYKDIVLGDGSDFVLPTDSNVETCLESGKDKCSRNIITFIDWHKFRAKSEILMDATQ
jgi:VWFA-related protein